MNNLGFSAKRFPTGVSLLMKSDDPTLKIASMNNCQAMTKTPFRASPSSFLCLFLLNLLLIPSLSADNFAPLPNEVFETSHSYGDFEIIDKVDATEDGYYPSCSVILKHKSVLKAEFKDFRADVIGASPDKRYFAALSNDGRSGGAFIVFNSDGDLIKDATHEQMDRRLFTFWSITLFRNWHSKKPNMEFVSEGGRLTHLYVSGKKFKRFDLMAENLAIDFEGRYQSLLTTPALLSHCSEHQDMPLFTERLQSLLKRVEEKDEPEAQAELNLMIPTLLEFHQKKPSHEAAIRLAEALADSSASCASRAKDILNGIAANEDHARQAFERMKFAYYFNSKRSWPQSMTALKSGGFLSEQGLIDAFVNEAEDPKAFHGYFFKFIKIPDGEDDFGILAYPAKPGISGKHMIFHQKNGDYFRQSEGLERDITSITDIDRKQWIKTRNIWR